MFDKGEDTFSVFLLRSHKSNTQCSCGGTPQIPVPGFVNNNIREVLLALDIRQRPVLSYASRLVAHRVRKALEHREGCHSIIFKGSLSRIL